METKSLPLFKEGDKLELPAAYEVKDFPYTSVASSNNTVYTTSTADKSRLYLHPTTKAGIYKLKSAQAGRAVWPENVGNKVAALFWDAYNHSHFQIHPLDSEVINVYGMKTPGKVGEKDVRHKQFCYFCHKVSEDKLMQCSRCKEVRYCDKECQKSDWSKHKKVCVSKNIKN